MRCIITTKGSNDFITYVDKEKAEVQIYQNKNSIAHLTLECISAAYNGNRLLYTTEKNGSIFITDLDNSHTIEVPTHYDAIFIEQILREFDDLVLLFTGSKYIIYCVQQTLRLAHLLLV